MSISARVENLVIKLCGSKQALVRLKKGTNSNLNIRKINFSLVSRNLVSFRSKFLHSGCKSLILTNRYDTRHFSNDLFPRCLILILLKEKNLITASFNTTKSCLRIYYWEIHEISWNSLKRHDTEKYHSSILKLKKYHSSILKLKKYHSSILKLKKYHSSIVQACLSKI